MNSSARSRTLCVRVSAAADALDRFEAAWHLATGRPKPAPVAVLSFADLPLLTGTLTPARWELLKALAKRLQRDYKNVHTDVAQLEGLGLIERTTGNLVRVAWSAIRAELRL